MAEGPSTRSHRSTLVWLGLFIVLAFTLRIAFSLDSSFDDESGRYVFTGNDPYYHYHVAEHILETGEHLRFDPAINYPNGAYNPNPPIYVWSAIPLAAALEGSVEDPIGLSLNIMVALWGAITLLPVYAIGKDMWGRKAGLWGAFLLAVSAPHIERSVAGYADHDAPTMFFIVLAFSAMVKALKSLHHREYVARWSSPERWSGIKAALKANAHSLKWSALAGVALTATALTWKGYPYALAILAFALAVQLVVESLKRRDATAVFATYVVPFAIVSVLPYLLYYRLFPTFLDTTVIPSLFVFLGVLVAGLLFVPTRNLPPTLVIPGAILIAVAGALGLKYGAPDTWHAVRTGLGYFQQSKLYSTIAEAQRPPIGRVAAAFGFATFLMVFWGLGRTLKGTFKGNAAMTLLTAWTLVALFMAFAAYRFVMNAAPIFALLVGATMATLMSMVGLDDFGRRLRARGSQGFSAAMGAFSWAAVLGAIMVAGFLVLPNAWSGFDAATTKQFEDEHGWDWEKIGAYGINHELLGEGWLDTMGHLRGLDGGPDAAIEGKPAFLAWWDYGHWAVGIGDHPTVADPFQNHYEVAGRILASESEQEAVGFLCLLLLSSDYHGDGPGFSPAVRAVVDQHPGLAAVGTETGYDADYKVLSASVNMTGDDVFDLYDDLQDATGKRIRYLGVDDRMYPANYYNPGIFYAPVFLANKLPEDFVETKLSTSTGGLTLDQRQYAMDDNNNSYRLKNAEFTGSDGKRYELFNGRAYPYGKTPLQGAEEDTGLPLNQQPELRPTEKFRNSMYARAFGGPLMWPSPSTGGFNQGTASGEGLTHWRTIHEAGEKHEDPAAAGLGPNATWRRTVLLEYYSGVDVTGRVTDDSGAPMAGVDVTFVDGFGAGHDVATTAADGSYSIRAPFSVDGDLTLTVRQGRTALAEDRTLQFTHEQAEAGGPAAAPTLVVSRGALHGIVYRDLDGADGYAAGGNDTVLEGVRIEAGGNSTLSRADGSWDLGLFQPGPVQVNATLAGYDSATRNVLVGASTGAEVDIALRPLLSRVSVNVTASGEPAVSVPIEFQGQTPGQAFTNANGTATTQLQPGQYTAVLNYPTTEADDKEYRYEGRLEFEVPFGGADLQLEMAATKSET